MVHSTQRSSGPGRGQSALGSPGLHLNRFLRPQPSLAAEKVSALAVPWKLPWAQTFASRGPAQRLSHRQPAFNGERTASLQTREWLDPHSFASQGCISSMGARFIL